MASIAAIGLLIVLVVLAIWSEDRFPHARGQLRAWSARHRLAVALLLLLVIVGVLWKIPEWQAGGVADQTSIQRANLEDEFRKTLATILAGIAVLLTGYLTWRNVSIAQQTLATSQEGQLTDRFTKAIGQLGATQDDGQPLMEVRLGGIYALERVARDSLRDHGPIMEVLTAYVRHHTRVTGDESLDSAKKYEPRADTKAILAVIGRRDARQWAADSTRRIDLHGTNLRGLVLKDACLENADFTGARLENAVFTGARLDGAVFEDAHLEGAIFNHVSGLTQAQIDQAYTDERTMLDPPLQGSSRLSPARSDEPSETATSGVPPWLGS